MLKKPLSSANNALGLLRDLEDCTALDECDHKEIYKLLRYYIEDIENDLTNLINEGGDNNEDNK